MYGSSEGSGETAHHLSLSYFNLPMQAFRFMVGLGHCPMFSKYGPSLSKAVDPSFLVLKISHFNKNIHLTASLRTQRNRKYM